MSSWLYVFLGGGLGSLARYGMSLLVTFLPQNFPYPTLISNVLASFLLGVFAAFLMNNENSWMRYLLVIGFCGGFSTFASYSYETFYLLKNGEMISAFLNIVGNTFLCLTAIGIGFFLGRNL